MSLSQMQSRTLGALTQFIGSGATPRGGSAVYTRQGIPFIRSQNVRDGMLDLANVVYIPEDVHAKMNRSVVRPHDVLLNITGASIGRSCVVPPSLSPANVNQHVCILRPTDEVLPAFLQAMLELPETQHRIREVAAGGSREGLNYDQVAGIAIPFLRMSDQIRFVAIRQEHNSLIHGLNSLITAKSSLKSELMRELLTGVQRFAPFKSPTDDVSSPPQDWCWHTLGDVATIAMSSVDKHVRGFEVPVRLCNYMDVWTHRYIRDDMPFMLGSATEAEASRFRLQPGDVLLTKDSETREDIAAPAVVLSTSSDLVAGYHLALIRPNSAILDGRFLAAQLCLPHVRNQFVRAAQGATRFGLTMNALTGATVLLPTIAEQRRIADFDLAAHRELHLLAEQQRQYEMLRNVMTHRLLSDDIPALDPAA